LLLEPLAKFALEAKFDDFGDGEKLLQIDILSRVGDLQKFYNSDKSADFAPNRNFARGS